MLSTTSLIGFVIAALVVLLIPGPGVLYAVARSAQQGYRAGLASAAGLSAGAMLHAIAAAAGLSALLATSSNAFMLVKLLGAAYLIYLGIRAILTRSVPISIQLTPPLPLRRLFADGVIVSVLNPKIALFFLAFLPQFVSPSHGAIEVQILLLGLLYSLLAFLTDGTYALLAGGLREWLGGKFMQGRIPNYVCGTLYIGLGINAALTGRRA